MEESLAKVKVVRGNRGESSSVDKFTHQDNACRRLIRSQYLKIIHVIREKRDDISSVDSNKFQSIMTQVEDLHKHVQKPREQVADGEALMNLSGTLLTSVKSHIGGGVTPSDFISCLLRDFTKVQGRKGTSDFEAAHKNSILWKEIGFAVSPIFKNFRGCCTMLGPMQTEVKQRNVAVYRKRAKQTESSQPQQLGNTGAEEKRTDTDENMLTMFDILKSKRRVKLESLILNRKSFAQTVENLFALSFLVKDGRVIMAVDEKGSHLVSPTNAADAPSVMLGKVAYSHFVFRYDFKDWKLMMDFLAVGEELMPHRDFSNIGSCSQGKPAAANANDCQAPLQHLATVKNLSVVVGDSSGIGDANSGIRRCKRTNSGIRRCKRKLEFLSV
ncbi:unnamed protein product [Camellia sinensis]